MINLLENKELNSRVTSNLLKVKYWWLFPAFVVLFIVYLFFANRQGDFTDVYVASQTDLFLWLNAKLSVNPNLQYNLTQLGDVLIVFPIVLIFIFCASKFWEALVSSSIISLILTAVLKKIFSVPRPAKALSHDAFTIVGRTLSGNNSFPSGHTITIFIVITIVLLAFMPKNNWAKVLWSAFILGLGVVVGLSRVAVGAHYPCDVFVGSIVGYLLAIIGILINKKTQWLAWAHKPKYYPIFMVIALAWSIVLIQKILTNNLPIFYVSLLSLIIILYLIIKSYVQNKTKLFGTDN